MLNKVLTYAGFVLSYITAISPIKKCAIFQRSFPFISLIIETSKCSDYPHSILHSLSYDVYTSKHRVDSPESVIAL